jgi:hypothetical protein
MTQAVGKILSISNPKMPLFWNSLEMRSGAIAHPETRLTVIEIWLNLWTEAPSRIFAMSDGFTHNKLGGTIAVIADRK